MPDFVSRVRGRGLRRLAMQQPVSQQLMQDAFSLSPDVDAVTKAIMDRKLTSADVQVPMQNANTIVSDYMEKFNKDPFYAFTREGRKAASNLKAIVNHPALKEWEQNATALEDEYKRVSTDRLNKNIVVNGNDVLAFKDGKRQYISINEIAKLNPTKGDRLLDVDTDVQHTRNVTGVRGGVPSYDMSRLSDIDQKITSALSGLGSTEVEGVRAGGEGVDNKFVRKDNQNQLKAALHTLMSTGLTTADKNTLKSEYIRSAGNAATSDGFHAWLSDRLSGVAAGKLSTVTSDLPQKAIGTGATGAGGNKEKELSPAQLALEGRYGVRNVENINSPYNVRNVVPGKGLAEFAPGSKLPIDLTLSPPGGQQFVDKLGNRYPIRKASELPAFARGTDLGAAQVWNKTSSGDDWRQLPGLDENLVLSAKEGAAPVVVYPYTYTDPSTGKPSQVPKEVVAAIEKYKTRGTEKIPPALQKYLTDVPIDQAIGEINRSPLSLAEKQQKIAVIQANDSGSGYVKTLATAPWIDATAIVAAPKGWRGSSVPLPANARVIGDQLQEMGYQGQQSDEMADYHAKYSGMGSGLDEGAFAIDDITREVPFRVPVISIQALHEAFGGKVEGGREDTQDTTMGLINNYQNMIAPGLYDQSLLNQTTKPASMYFDNHK